ncbi:hypothetical protein ACTPD5_21540 [Clostridioides difficile]
MACNTCKMCESADKKLESFVASKDVETAFHRTEAMGLTNLLLDDIFLLL